MAETWETIFEGENAAIFGGNGYNYSLWDNASKVNTLSAGDIVRVTLDETVYVYTMQSPRYDTTVQAGNYWLSMYEDSTEYQDDGTDFYFFEMNGYALGYTRTYGTHYVKIERLVPVPVTGTDPNALIQGWIVGKRLAAQRGRAGA